MNCKRFSKYTGEYVNRTLPADVLADAELHLSSCVSCASLVRELENTSAMVRALDRECAPVGFEQRLKERIASRAATSHASDSLACRWLNAIGTAIMGKSVEGRRPGLRPALVALSLCVIVLGSFVLFGPSMQTASSDTDWAYIGTCQEQHAQFASANPLADEAAVILRERARESDEL